MNSVYKFIKENHVLAVVEIACLKKSFTLNLSRFEVSDVPELLTTCASLLKLYLDHNEIIKIPESIVDLKRLNSLTLDYNRLNEFPLVICKLTTLRFLNLSCNNIRVIPPEIGELTNLESLWINNAGLEHIPEEVGLCEGLHTFGVRNNQITQLPESLGLLKKLTWLTVESNQLSVLPKTFEILPKLTHLNLRKNRFSVLPAAIPKIRTLRFCFLDENCIEEIENEYVDNTRFIKILDITGNPVVNREEFRRLLPAYKHIIYEKHDNNIPDISGDEEEDQSDWENSVATSDINSTDDSGDERNMEDISAFIPQLSRYITTFS